MPRPRSIYAAWRWCSSGRLQLKHQTAGGDSPRETLANLAKRSIRADDDEAFRISYWNGHHDSGRSSIQSTYNRRSEKSHAPSIFTNVSS